MYWCVFLGVYPVYTSSKLCEFVWTSDMRHFVSKTAFSIVLFIQQLIQLLLPFHFHFFYSSHFRCISSRLHKPFSPDIYISASPHSEREKKSKVSNSKNSKVFNCQKCHQCSLRVGGRKNLYKICAEYFTFFSTIPIT